MINLITTFLKISFLGFGGGYAMLSLIFEESAKLGITSQQFYDLNALDLLAPGPIAVNSATYVGYITFGLMGAILATIAVCSSSLVFSSLLLKFEKTFQENKIISKFLSYIKVAAIAMISAVALSLVVNTLKDDTSLLTSVLAILVTVLLRFKYKTNTVLVLLIVASLGSGVYFLELLQ